jgi:GTP-binding protein Era
MERREDRDMMDVYATIYCERESHKGIIIGKGGSMLKRIGQESRKDIEWMLGCQVNLQLWIKIKEDWRNRPGMLHELGYE